MINKIILSLLLMMMLSGYLDAQDIEHVLKSKTVTMTGGFSANTSLYESWGMDSRQDPFGWQFVANINFNFYGIVNMPFSAYFAKENVRYQQPSFNIAGISPRYKSVTLHLGYRNMTFSPYTLAGLTFFGAGVEYVPQHSWFKASAMVGRFFKAVPATDSAQNLFKDPSYERWGGGFSLTAFTKKNELTLVIFKASDKLGSIPDPPASTGITPAENFIMGFTTRDELLPKLVVSLGYTLSAYTADIRNEVRDFQSYTYLNNFGKLFTPRFSSMLSKALESSVNYQGATFSIGGSYKRIDPGFASMGSTFVENDLEDMLFNISKSFAKNKLNFSGNIGQQRNNLTHEKQSENKRVVGSLNGVWTMSPSFSVNANFSNFTSNTTPTLINFTDSVKYFQINKNTSLNLNYNKSTAIVRHSVNLMVSLQEATSLNRSATLSLQASNQMVNTCISYQVNLPVTGVGGTLSFQNSIFKNELVTTRNYGPNLSINKDVLKKKIKLIISYSYSLTKMTTATNNNSTQVIRLNADCQLNKHQSLRFQTSYMHRVSESITGKIAPKELQVNLAYQYTF